ncbi:unnamed protein product [Meganyctiphanes norvegica]|uniref:C-type lectin domain-containing protein n=1 Tax=Meganyctiphanes norvegica TaxID=48144 RepID=A0AAV2S4K7_MEGNR
MMVSVLLILLICLKVSPLMIINPLKKSYFLSNQYENTNNLIPRHISNGKNSSLGQPTSRINKWKHKIDPHSKKYKDSGVSKSYFACPPNYKPIEGKCYGVMNNEHLLTISSAQNICKLVPGGQLTGKPLNKWGNWTESLELTFGLFLWVNINKTHQGWFWPNGDPVVEWNKNQPDGTGGADACAAVFGGPDKLFETLCTGKSPYVIVTGMICEAPTRGICNEHECVCTKGYYGRSCQYECSTSCVWPYMCSDVGNISVCRCHEGSIEEGGGCTSLVICPVNFIEIFGYCYKRSDDVKIWQDAQMSCQNIPGGSLSEPSLSYWDIWIRGSK